MCVRIRPSRRAWSSALSVSGVPSACWKNQSGVWLCHTSVWACTRWPFAIAKSMISSAASNVNVPSVGWIASGFIAFSWVIWS